MRTRTSIAAFLAAAGLLMASPVFAQGMMGWYPRDAAPAASADIAREEAAGKAVWDRLQTKQASCADLSEDDFELLGDYFMGLMMGSSHAAMDAAMDARLGEQGNRQMHVAMGKRMSGCDPAAALPQGGAFPMMGGGYGMMGRAGSPYAAGWPAGVPSGIPVAACLITIALVWVALTLSIIALLTWLAKQRK